MDARRRPRLGRCVDYWSHAQVYIGIWLYVCSSSEEVRDDRNEPRFRAVRRWGGGFGVHAVEVVCKYCM